MTSVLLAGDVGGTKTILRLVATTGGTGDVAETLAETTCESGEFPDLAPMARRFLAAAAARLGSSPAPAAACFGIAGPVEDNACEVTNLGWSLDGGRLAEQLGIPRVELINDFAAIGHGVPVLGPADLHTLQPGQPDPEAPVAVIGAGTGLGEGFLIPYPGGHRVFGGEGGHVDFPPRSDLEFELLRHLRQTRDLTHVSVERIVSGQGIAAIYEFLRQRDPGRESAAMAAVFAAWQEGKGGEGTVDLAAEVSRAAIGGGRPPGDPLSRRTMEVFVEAYGAEAGNLALKLLPYGGLYVAGGIAAKILPLLTDGRFLAAFHGKGRMRPLVEKVPLHVVLEPRVGLLGAVRCASRLLA